MPRKTRRAASSARSAGRFNEAAARCRGKPDHPGQDGRDDAASMRPRPDAAENELEPHLLDGGVAASMRPRPDAAENRTRSSATAAQRRSLQ